MTEAEAYVKVQRIAEEARPRGWIRLTVPKSRPPGGLTVQVMPGVRGELLCVTERGDQFIAVALVRVEQLDRWLTRHATWRPA